MTLELVSFYILKLFLYISILLGFAAAVLFVYIAKVRWTYSHIRGPPMDNFFLGHLLTLKRYSINPQKLWIEWGKKYGPVYKIHILHLPTLVICDAKLIKEICLDSDKFNKSKAVYRQLATMAGERCLGSSVLVETDQKLWKTRRLGLNPAFHLNFLNEFSNTFSATGDLLVETLNEVADGETSVNLFDYVTRLGIDVICNVGFGFYPQTIKNDPSPFPTGLYSMLKFLSLSFNDPLLSYGLNPWKRKEFNEGAGSLKFLRQTGRTIIRERLALIRSGQDTESDILNTLLKNLGHQLSEEALIDEFITFFIAGQETTSNSIAFLFMLLGQNPDAMQKIYDEVDLLTSRNPYPKYDDIRTLEYLEASWKESLRLFPPANGSARESDTSQMIGGFSIPANTVIFTDFVASQRLCTDDGDSFSPERHFEQSKDQELCFIPFSIGQRSCIGRNFAQMEAMILLYKLFANFNIEVIPDQSFDIEQALTFRLLGGIQVRLTKRNVRQTRGHTHR